MEYRGFGRSGLKVSVLGFGCGAVGGFMVRGDHADQERTVARAIDAGVNYFDTAVQYGDGESEKNLGRVLQKLKPADVVVGTKVRVPASEFERMRAPFQVGEFPAPVKYGYVSVGEIERGPREFEGRPAFVLYPHQTKYVVPASAIHVLPPSVPAARAVLAANMETAVNGVWDAAIKPGDRVVVIGGGAVGCLAAWLAARTASYCSDSSVTMISVSTVPEAGPPIRRRAWVSAS